MKKKKVVTHLPPVYKEYIINKLIIYYNYNTSSYAHYAPPVL